MAWLFWICLNLFLAISIIMVLLVLIQKGRGGGLAGAFGGAGGKTAFGSKTGDVLTWATSVLFGVFLFLAVCVNWVSNAMEDNNRKQFQARSRPRVRSPRRSPPSRACRCRRPRSDRGDPGRVTRPVIP